MPLTMQVFDVGQGDGNLIVFPNGKTMLVDLGTTKGIKVTLPSILKYCEKVPRFTKKPATLDYLVLTHPDHDHYNMVQPLLEKFMIRVKNLTYGGQLDGKSKDKTSKGYSALIQLLKDNNPKMNILLPDELPSYLDSEDQFGGATVSVLACNTSGGPKKDRSNTVSVVLMVEYGGERILLMGDATKTTEDRVITNLRENLGSTAKMEKALQCSILKVAHHGSYRTSNALRFLRLAKPEFAFVTADRLGVLQDARDPEDPEDDGDISTGYRLPQYLTLDLIRRASDRLHPTEPHGCVSSFEIQDYQKFDEPPYNGKKRLTPMSLDGVTPIKEDSLDAWIISETTSGIFTTLVALDQKQKNESVADIGAQYSITIGDKGGINVKTTYEDDVEPVTIAQAHPDRRRPRSP